MPTRPTLRRSPALARPCTTTQHTIGATTMEISLRNASLKNFRPCAVSGAATPMTIPSSSAIRTWVNSEPNNPVLPPAAPTGLTSVAVMISPRSRSSGVPCSAHHGFVIPDALCPGSQRKATAPLPQFVAATAVFPIIELDEFSSIGATTELRSPPQAGEAHTADVAKESSETEWSTHGTRSHRETDPRCSTRKRDARYFSNGMYR